MIERKVIRFNPRLGDKFFEVAEGLPDLESLRREVSFPLPTSIVSMPEFFRSPEAQQFRKEVTALILRLQAWCQANQVRCSDDILRFLHICRTYHGRDPDANVYGFELLSSGIVLLNAIVNHCESGKLPKELCRNAIINLLPGLTVCSPGIYTNLYKAWCSLVSQNSFAHELMQIRHHLAEQSAIAAINSLKGKNRVHPGSEIHYVNALLNCYHEVLGIPRIADAYLENLDSDILVILIDLFVIYVTQKLKPCLIMDEIVNQLNLSAFYKETRLALQHKNFARFNALIDDFESRLNRYGEDKFNIDQVLMMNEDGTEVTGLAFFHQEELNASLQRRFMVNGYFTTETFRRRVIGHGNIVYTNSQIALNESFIEVQGGIRSYIPFMMEQIQNDGPLLSDLIEHINSSAHFKRQIVEAIIDLLFLNEHQSRLSHEQELKYLRFLSTMRTPTLFSNLPKLSRYYRYHLAKTLLSECYPDDHVSLFAELAVKFDCDEVYRMQFKKSLILLQSLCGSSFSINQYNAEVDSTGLQIAQLWQLYKIEATLINREKALIGNLSTRTFFHQSQDGRVSSEDELSSRKPLRVTGKRY